MQDLGCSGLAGDTIPAVGGLPEVCRLGAAALAVTPAHTWTRARVSCSSMSSEQHIRPEVVWPGLGRGLLPPAAAHGLWGDFLSVCISCTILWR